ncbi:MAG TPA: UrcA family protein [Sphingomicrobium sp.]|nr:UrcA family protein [Sphingomicrobium sp.]
MKSTFIIAGAAALLSATVNAQQITVIADAPPTARVSFADLDVFSDAGHARLEQRVRAAAGTLCLENNVDSIETKMARRECYNSAVADGYRQMNSIIASGKSGASLAAASLIVRAH